MIRESKAKKRGLEGLDEGGLESVRVDTMDTVTISEAVALLGVSDTTVQKRIGKGGPASTQGRARTLVNHPLIT